MRKIMFNDKYGLMEAVLEDRKVQTRRLVRTIYGYEGKPIGEEVDGKVNWYYSDGAAGGTKGGHYMGTMEFLTFNNLL